MLNALRNKKLISIYKPEEFPIIDNEKISIELDVVASARHQASKELPNSNAKSPDSNEIKYRSKFQTQLIQKSHSVQQSLNCLSDEINNLSIQHYFSNAKSSPCEFEQTVRSEMTISLRELKDLKKQFDLANEDLAQFKSMNKLNREPDYPVSSIKTFGLLFFFMLIEAIANGFFFAEGSDSGLLGGIAIASAIAFVNVTFGFLMGLLVLRYKNHVIKWKSYFSLIFFSVVMFLVCIGNLFIAHYREALNSYPDNAPEYVWKLIESGWFSVSDINSWLLFFVGIFFFILATYKGYKSDDEYPKYGRFAKLKEKALDDLMEEKRAILDYVDEKYEEAIETIEANFHIIKNSTKGLANSISSFEMQKKIFDNYVTHSESALTYVTKLYRDINSETRTTPPPEYFENDFNFKLNFEPLHFNYKDKRDELIQLKNKLENQLPSLREKLNSSKNMFHNEVDRASH